MKKIMIMACCLFVIGCGKKANRSVNRPVIVQDTVVYVPTIDPKEDLILAQKKYAERLLPYFKKCKIRNMKDVIKFAKNYPPEDFGYTPMTLEEKQKMDTMIDAQYSIWFHVENNMMIIDTTINDIRYISEYLEPHEPRIIIENFEKFKRNKKSLLD